MTTASFSIGESEHQRVEVAVLRYEREPSGDYYDDNWLAVEVSLAVGGFKGRYDASFLTTELKSFRDQAASLYESLSGEAKLDTLETQLRLTLVGNGKGNISLEGEAWDQPGIGNRLVFRLGLDQTYLAHTLKQLDAVVTRFPVRAG